MRIPAISLTPPLYICSKLNPFILVPLILAAALIALAVLFLPGARPVLGQDVVPQPCLAPGAVAVSDRTNTGLMADCNVLLDAKEALLGTTATTLNWSPDLSIEKWDGIWLGGTPKRVTVLNLSSKQLNGKIPSTIGYLSNLQTLNLRDNRLTGKIPVSDPGYIDRNSGSLTARQIYEYSAGLDTLSNLQLLNLAANQLGDFIPWQLGRLSNLQHLYISYNNLRGEIPTELDNLSDLQTITIRGNEFKGCVPKRLWTRMNNGEISHDNRPIRDIPDTDIDESRSALPSCANSLPYFASDTAARSVPEKGKAGTAVGAQVTATDVEGDALTYRFGPTLNPDGSYLQREDGAWLVRQIFDINATTGQITTKAPLDRNARPIHKFKVVVQDGKDYNGNPDTSRHDRHRGTIIVTVTVTEACDICTSPEFASATTTRSVAENTEAGVDIGDPVTATDDDGDPLTYELGGADRASFTLDTSNGQLSTKAALDYESKPSYSVTVSVSDGEDGAGNPDSSVDDTIDVTIEITNVMEAESCEHAEATAVADKSNTGLAADCNALLAAMDTLIGTSTATLNWSLTHPIKWWDGVHLGGTPSRVSELHLESRSLSGQIAPELGSLSELERLYLYGNSLTGSIPPELGSLSELERLQLNNNSLTGSIPPELGSLSELERLHLRANQLTGSIPRELAGLSNLEQLYLGRNQLTGCVPPELRDVQSNDLIALRLPTCNSQPQFGSARITRSVAENTAADVDIGSPITATDPDDGDTLTYALGGVDRGSFALDTASGQLSTKAALDYEVKRSYTVTVSVSDGKGYEGNPDSSADDTIDVTIEVTDVVETCDTCTSPEFASATTTLSVAENTAAGVDIGGPITATDDDGDTLTYSLFGVDSVAFSLDTPTGQLKTKAALDYENKRSYTFLLVVSDGEDANGYPDSAADDTIKVTIEITNVNERPRFATATTTRSVPENTEIGESFGDPITATDPEGDPLTYVLGGTDRIMFLVDRTTGQLRTRAPLSYEYYNRYTVTVHVGDHKDDNGDRDQYLDDSIEVTIEVTNVEFTCDACTSPEFATATTTRSVAENTAAGVDIGDPITATDDDGDTLTYELGGPDAGLFDLDTSNGQLTTKGALDYENDASHTVTVSVSDREDHEGDPDSSADDTIEVTIEVTNVHESPRFASARVTRSVAENTGPDVDIGDPITATDGDGDPLTYVLWAGADGDSFALDPYTGQLKTKAALDYENKRSYTVTVVVSDRKDANGAPDRVIDDTIDVTILVTDVNEPPEFATATTTRSVAENTAAGVDIGGLITATDPDGDPLTYSLRGADRDSFALDTSNGQLKTKAALDYEVKRSYTVIVDVSDGEDASGNPDVTSDDEIAVTIEITDANDPPEFATATTTRSVAENTAAGVDIGGPITATDPDGDPLTYSLRGADRDSFALDTSNGQLSTKAALDYEGKRSYTVIVDVSDGEDAGGNPDVTSDDEIAVTIDVTNVVDTCEECTSPRFGLDRTTRSVPENTGAGENIGLPVTATDGDGDPLTYALGGADEAAFSLDPSTGQLTTHAPLDYEKKSSYTVVVSVSDREDAHGAPDRVIDDTIDVTILVTDVSECDHCALPQFASATTTRSVAENTAAGVDIGAAVAADYEGGGSLTYELGGADKDLFALDVSSGQLMTKAALDYESGAASYKVTVSVTDGTDSNGDPDPSADDTIEVTIEIANVVECEDADGPVSDRSNTGLLADCEILLAAKDTLRGTAALNWSMDVSIEQWDGVYLTGTPERVSALVLAASGITLSGRLPADLGKLSGLISINLGGNRLTGPIPAELGDLTNLQALYLQGNQLSGRIPPELGSLSSLRELYLGGNQFSVCIPERLLALGVRKNDLDDLALPSCSPKFGTASTTRSVAENTAAGVNIGDPVTATSGGDDTLTYSLVGHSSVFSLNTSTGQLMTRGALDYETTRSYEVAIVVLDGEDDFGNPDPQIDHAIKVIIEITNVVDPDTCEHAEATAVAGRSNAGLVSDCNALLAAKDTLLGTTTATLDWSLTRPIERWDAVALEGTPDRVTRLTLGKRQLAGQIAPELGRLSELEELHLQQNGLSGSIPPELGQLTNLEYLYLDYNNLSGSIPAELGDLPLKRLRLEANAQLSGCVPYSLVDTSSDVLDLGLPTCNPQPEFGSATTTRSVSENRKAGVDIGDPVAATDEDDDSLTYALSGTDSASFALDTSTGQLTTTFRLDYEVKPSYSVTVSVTDGEDDHGSPDSSVDDTIEVTILVTDAEECTDCAPPQFGSATTTRSVAENTDAGENIGEPVAATDPDGGGALTYELGGNDSASFELDTATGQLTTKHDLDYEAKPSYVVTVSVTDGRDHNGRPDPTVDDTIVVTIEVTDVPEFCGDFSTSNPGLASDCEKLLSVKDTLRGTANLNWSATLPVANWTGVRLGGSPHRVTELHLNDRFLTGRIPGELGSLGRLEWLNLGNNGLSGEIPAQLGSLSNLRVLYLANNRLSGRIPRELGQLSNLLTLHLRDNRLSGGVPNAINRLPNLQWIDLGDNEFCGSAVSDRSNTGLLADCNALLAAKDTLRGTANLNWSGSRPIERWDGVTLSGSPLRVTALNLFKKRLNGQISVELGSLSGLQELSLGSNSLSGVIPAELGDLSNLRKLSLRNNSLSGVIPAELGGLSSLQDLRLRNNQFSGCVPSALRNVPKNDLKQLGLKYCN